MTVGTQGQSFETKIDTEIVKETSQYNELEERRLCKIELYCLNFASTVLHKFLASIFVSWFVSLPGGNFDVAR